MENGVIYCHELLKDSELDGPFKASVQLLRRRLDEFFLGDGDYERIERYLRCLVFDPQGPRRPGDAEKEAETAS